MKSNIISIQNHHMSSGAILHQHRTRREDGSRWHMMLSLFIFISAFSLPLVSSSFIPAYAGTTTLTVDNSNTVLELTLPSSLTLDLTPSSANNFTAFSTASLNVGVGTNNTAGYTLSMTVPSLNLVNSAITMEANNNPNGITLDADSHPTIEPLATLAGGYTENTFTINKWGYRLDSGNFFPMTASAIELSKTSSPSNATGSEAIIGLAAKVNATQPAGNYSTILNFAAVANAPVDCSVDLTGCEFYFNSTISTTNLNNIASTSSLYSTNAGFFDISFSSNSKDYIALGATAYCTFNLSYRYSNGTDVAYYGPCASQQTIRGVAPPEPPTIPGYWNDDIYRTITITGGADATNIYLIDWIYDNANLQ